MMVWRCGVDYAQGDCIHPFDEEMHYDFGEAFEYG